MSTPIVSTSTEDSTFPRCAPAEIHCQQEFLRVLQHCEDQLNKFNQPKDQEYYDALMARYDSVCLVGLIQGTAAVTKCSPAEVLEGLREGWKSGEYSDSWFVLGLSNDDTGDQLLSDALDSHLYRCPDRDLSLLDLTEDLSGWGLPPVVVFDIKYVEVLLDE